MKLEQALKIAKQFTKSITKKDPSRPILGTALVTESHVIATDSHRLVRIKHDEQVNEPYLHRYKKSDAEGYDVASYPNIERVIPRAYDSQKEISIDVAEFREAHESASVAAKEHKNKVAYLCGSTIEVDANQSKDKFNQLSFRYRLDRDTGISIAYNCTYMLDVLKALKKAKLDEMKMHYYGTLRPMLFANEEIEIVLMPLKSEKAKFNEGRVA